MGKINRIRRNIFRNKELRQKNKGFILYNL